MKYIWTHPSYCRKIGIYTNTTNIPLTIPGSLKRI